DPLTPHLTSASRGCGRTSKFAGTVAGHADPAASRARVPGQVPLRPRLEHADLGPGFPGLPGDGKVQPTGFGNEVARARVLDGGHVFDQLVMVRVDLLHDGDRAFTTGRVDSLPLGIKEYVVRIAGDWQPRDLRPRLRVHNHQHRRLAAADEE